MITPHIIFRGAAEKIREYGLAKGVYAEKLYTPVSDELEQETGDYRYCVLGAMRYVTFGHHLLPAVGYSEEMEAYRRAEEILAQGLIGKRGGSRQDIITRWSDDTDSKTVIEVLEAAAEVAP